MFRLFKIESVALLPIEEGHGRIVHCAAPQHKLRASRLRSQGTPAETQDPVCSACIKAKCGKKMGKGKVGWISGFSAGSLAGKRCPKLTLKWLHNCPNLLNAPRVLAEPKFGNQVWVSVCGNWGVGTSHQGKRKWHTFTPVSI